MFRYYQLTVKKTIEKLGTNLGGLSNREAERRLEKHGLNELEEKNIVQKNQKGSRNVYSLTEEVIKKWSKMLGFNI